MAEMKEKDKKNLWRNICIILLVVFVVGMCTAPRYQTVDPNIKELSSMMDKQNEIQKESYQQTKDILQTYNSIQKNQDKQMADALKLLNSSLT